LGKGGNGRKNQGEFEGGKKKRFLGLKEKTYAGGGGKGVTKRSVRPLTKKMCQKVHGRPVIPP